MLKNYLKVALRTLRRNKGYTAINVGGLAVGLAACLLIGLWVRHQLSYADFHENADRIHRLTLQQENAEGAGETVRRAVTPPALGPALERDLPAVEEAVRLGGGSTSDALVRVGGTTFQENTFAFADSSFFEVFDGFNLRRGSPSEALARPNGVVLTQSAAERYFPDQNPMGRTLHVEAGRWELDLVVTGVMEDVPPNAHFDFDLLANRTAMAEQIAGLADDVWWLFGDYTYALLEEGASAETLSRQLPAFAQRHTDVRRGTQLRFGLQPLPSIHLHSHLESEWAPNGHVLYVWTLGVAGLLVLLVAAFNFVNLATARLSERALEAGVRRAVGAQRGQVAARFLAESLLIALAAGVLAVLLARAGRPLVEAFLEQRLVGGGFLEMVSLGLSAALAGGLGAGAYPALALSGFRPSAVLQGQASGRGRRGALLRKGLVAAQFAFAVALIAGAGVVHQQFSFLLDKDLGLQTERIAVLPAPPDAPSPETVRQTLGNYSSVKGVTAANRVPTQVNYTNSAIIPEGRRQSIPIQWNPVGPHFTDVMDLHITEGRALDPARAADSAAFLVNRTAARRFGWQEPLGKSLRSPATGDVMGRVVGVTEDAHFQSLRRTIAPGVFFLGRPSALRHYLVRLHPGQVAEGMAHLERAWQQLAPTQPSDVTFLDEQYEALYQSEQRLRTLFSIFAGLAVLLACLGLFGLAAFAAERRRKEIAVRKTFGASTRQIVALLSKDFLKLVAVGFLIAAPVAWYGMSRWLQDFAYRVELGPLVFLAAGALALLVALAATGTQALRAARTNPAQALRDE